jgi:hypothetical protein
MLLDLLAQAEQAHDSEKTGVGFGADDKAGNRCGDEERRATYRSFPVRSNPDRRTESRY